MTSLIVTSLRETGPCLSSVLVEEMLKTQGVNRDTARKQISRAAYAGQIHCVDKLFPQARTIYLSETAVWYWALLVQSQYSPP